MKPNQTPFARAKRRAFTLVEPLVVIASIARLSARRLPAWSKAKDQAKGLQRMDTPRQMMLGGNRYPDDYNCQSRTAIAEL